jgi:propionyl-CoA carboxylase alpha chain
MTTNRDFLVRVLRHPEFLEGEADTGFLDRHDLSAPLIADTRVAAAAAALAGQAARRARARTLATLPSGWRNNPSQLQVTRFDRHEVGYRFDRHGRLAELRIDGEPLDTPRLHTCTPELVDLEVAGVRRRHRVAPTAVNTDEGQVDLRELPRFPDPQQTAGAGSLVSPMPGAVVRVLVEAGAAVEAGRPLLVLEAMKMEHEVVAPVAGTVAELRVREGAQVEAGAVLAVIEDGTTGS